MKLNNKNVVITSAVRTAIGAFDGSLKHTQGHDLGSIVIKKILKKSKLKSKDVDEVIMGQVLTAAVGKIQHVKLLSKLEFQSIKQHMLLIKFVAQD